MSCSCDKSCVISYISDFIRLKNILFGCIKFFVFMILNSMYLLVHNKHIFMPKREQNEPMPYDQSQYIFTLT